MYVGMYLIWLSCSTWNLHCRVQDLQLWPVGSWLQRAGPSSLIRDWT